MTRRLRAVAGFVLPLAAAMLLAFAATSRAQTPISGHYPPGQSGIRGAATPPVGWAVTNFNRFFTNLAVKDAQGATTSEVNELRYANITMITWVTPWKVLGMHYGALAGIPFATGNLRASESDLQSSSFGLGDVLLTPVSMFGIAPTYDYQFQFTFWTASGRFSEAGTNNRGSGFKALVYSVGGTYYPGGARDDWSAAAVARFEQNFEQRDTGVMPGDDVVIDWGVGKVLRAGGRPLELGVSGFATWQLSKQVNEITGTETSPYRYFGVGPEANLAISDAFALRLRMHWELGVVNSLEGNGIWLIANFKL